MLHQDKDKFVKLIERVAAATGFYAPLVEKDYYLTVILSEIHTLSENLIFKGGTCLNKIYYAYYRLSEDLDFTLRLPHDAATRGQRRTCIQPIKERIAKFVQPLGLRIEGAADAGRNSSRQYVYQIVYDSVLLPTPQTIKFEVGLRHNPLNKTETKKVQHKFLNPFTGEPLFPGGAVTCLSLKEIVSEKLRAAALRETIAPRDFYDLDFILRQGFDLADHEVQELFAGKLMEDGGDPDLARYRCNLGRHEQEIHDLRSRIENELLDVLTLAERKNFNLDSALARINQAMSG